MSWLHIYQLLSKLNLLLISAASLNASVSLLYFMVLLLGVCCLNAISTLILSLLFQSVFFYIVISQPMLSSISWNLLRLASFLSIYSIYLCSLQWFHAFRHWLQNSWFVIYYAFGKVCSLNILYTFSMVLPRLGLLGVVRLGLLFYIDLYIWVLLLLVFGIVLYII